MSMTRFSFRGDLLQLGHDHAAGTNTLQLVSRQSGREISIVGLTEEECRQFGPYLWDELVLTLQGEKQ